MKTKVTLETYENSEGVEMADSESCSIIGTGYLISDFLDDRILVICRPVLFLYEVVHLYLDILNVVLRLFPLRLHLTL